ncbi:serine/threonine-protein kinase [Amycolatopsis sp. NPDC051371]|uniref:serine/threonine-protein kinase n=1 Tax=Amycolatopsis sp. NPDC051371 TaxID=3155800 RepID=UPI003435D628
MADDEELIGGRYRLLSRVGPAQFGVVWRARDEQLDRVVAVKQLVPHRATGKAALRAMREARVAARVSHPHAVTVYDVLEHDGKLCLVMELLPTSLTELLLDRGALPQGMVATIGSQVAAALATAHADGVLHRDVSPGNVLLAADGLAKIADFGIARAVGEPLVTDRPFVPGTPAFLAPEVAAGTDATELSDVYSLGATLYAALEGRPPIEAAEENTITLLARIAREEVPPPVRNGPLSDVLMRLLARDPADRPPMVEAQELLAKAAAGPRVSQARPVTSSRQRRPRARGVLLAGVVAGLAMVFAGIGLSGGGLQLPGSSIARPGAVPVTTGNPTAVGVGTCVAAAEVVESWQGGYKALVTVRNTGNVVTRGWTVSWQPAGGRRIVDLWDGAITRAGSSVTVVNAAWNAGVKAEDATTFGLIAVDHGSSRASEVLSCAVR